MVSELSLENRNKLKASPVLLTFNGEVRGEERENTWPLISGLFYG